MEPELFVSVRVETLSHLKEQCLSRDVMKEVFKGFNVVEWSLVHSKQEIYQYLRKSIEPTTLWDPEYCLALSGDMDLIGFVLEELSGEEKKLSYMRNILLNIVYLIKWSETKLFTIRPDLNLKQMGEVFFKIEEIVESVVPDYDPLERDNLLSDLLRNQQYEKLECMLDQGLKFTPRALFKGLLNHQNQDGALTFLRISKVLFSFESQDILSLTRDLIEEGDFRTVIRLAIEGLCLTYFAIDCIFDSDNSPDIIIFLIKELYKIQKFEMKVWHIIQKRIFENINDTESYDCGDLLGLTTENKFDQDFIVWLYRQNHGVPKLSQTAGFIIRKFFGTKSSDQFNIIQECIRMLKQR